MKPNRSVSGDQPEVGSGPSGPAESGRRAARAPVGSLASSPRSADFRDAPFKGLDWQRERQFNLNRGCEQDGCFW